jgi:hypothetical protein
MIARTPPQASDDDFDIDFGDDDDFDPEGEDSPPIVSEDDGPPFAPPPDELPEYPGLDDYESDEAAALNPLISSSGQFTHDFVPPEYLLDGILQRRFCYALTAKTGTGKTAIMLRLAAHVALGRPIGKREVEKGKVLYFAGENPDDLRMRWIGLAQEMAFDPEEVSIYFIAGTFQISKMQERIRQEMDRIGEFSLLVVDTSAAYFEGDDENSNTQARSTATSPPARMTARSRCTGRGSIEGRSFPRSYSACGPSRTNVSRTAGAASSRPWSTGRNCSWNTVFP